MKTVLKICLMLLFVPFSLKAQDTLTSYTASLEFIFTGEVKNEFDSVFRMQYVIEALDIQYDINEVKDIKDSIDYASGLMLTGKYVNIKKVGNKLYLDMGIYKPDEDLPQLRFKDNKGRSHRVKVKAPWGEIGDVEQYNRQRRDESK